MLANLSSPAKARLRKAGEYVHETHKITTMFFSSYVDEIKQQDITGRPKPYGAVELILGPMFAGTSQSAPRKGMVLQQIKMMKSNFREVNRAYSEGEGCKGCWLPGCSG
jgi:hypothetical protein